VGGAPPPYCVVENRGKDLFCGGGEGWVKEKKKSTLRYAGGIVKTNYNGVKILPVTAFHKYTTLKVKR
jgi:hypothetical protein